MNARCGQCGAALSTDQGLCPACVLREAIAGGVVALGESGGGETRSLSAANETPGTSGDKSGDDLSFLRPCSKPDRLGMLGHYEIIDVLGRGGMGIVFRAYDPKLARLVALKTMKPELARNEAARQRFLREARAVAAIEHENIVAIFQVDEESSVPFFAMRFLQGVSLRELLEKRRVLPPLEVLAIGRQIAAGLMAAHERDVIHRDIKPANIFLSDSGEVRILDFGLARAVVADNTVTRSGEILGTPAYMAPEQAQKKPVDHRCDLFSLGCVLYQMCTGELPFSGDDTLSVLMALAVSNPPPPHERNPVVPGALSDLIVKLLAKEPSKRPGTAREVWEELGAIERRMKEEAAPTGPSRNDDTAVEASAHSTTAITSAVHAPHGRRIWPLVAIVALLALIPLGFLFGGAVIRFATNKGELVVEVNDPSVEVLVKHNGVELRDRKAERTFWLTPGEGEIQVYEKDGLGPLFTKKFTLNRGGSTTVVVTLQEVAAAKTPVKVAEKTPDKVDKEKPPVIKTATWERGSEKEALPGLIPFPTSLKGGERWQVWEEHPAATVQMVHWSPDGQWIAVRTVQFDGSYRILLHEAASKRLARVLWTGHGGPTYMRWSPDSKWLCVTEEDLTLFCRPDGTAGPRLPSHRNFNFFRWSPDSRHVLGFSEPVTSEEKRALIFDAKEGKRVDLEGHAAKLTDGRWSPDGQWLATTSEDKTARLWRPDGKPGPVLDKHTEPLLCVAWHPLSQTLATASADGTVRLWNIDGSAGPVLDHDKTPVWECFWSKDGKHLVTCTRKPKETEGTLRLWTADGKLVHVYPGEYALASPSHHHHYRNWEGFANLRPDNDGFLAYHRSKENFHYWDVVSLPFGAGPATLISDMPGEIAWSPDGKRLLLWGAPFLHGFAHLCRLEGKTFTRLPFDFMPRNSLEGPCSVSWSPRSDYALFGLGANASRGGAGLLLFHADGKKAQTLIEPPLIRTLAVSPRGDRFATGEHWGNLRIWNIDGTPGRSWSIGADPPADTETPANSIGDLDWHPDGRYLACANNNRVIVWDTATGKTQAQLELQVHPELGASAAFQPGDVNILAVSGQGKGALWKWQTEETPKTWFDNFSTGTISWSPDGQRFAAPNGESDKSRIWKADGTLEAEFTVPMSESAFARMAWDPPGKRLLVASDSQPLRILDRKGNLEKTFGGGLKAAWSADGKHMASLAEDLSGPKLWNADAEPGPPLDAVHCLKRYPALMALAFTPDSKKLIAASGNRIAIWHTATGQLDRLIVLLSKGNAVFSPAGELLFITPGAEAELRFIVQREGGRLDLVPYAAVEKMRAGN